QAYTYGVSAVSLAGEGDVGQSGAVSVASRDFLSPSDLRNVTLRVTGAPQGMPTLSQAGNPFGNGLSNPGVAIATSTDGVNNYRVTLRARDQNDPTSNPQSGQSMFTTGATPKFYLYPETTRLTANGVDLTLYLVWGNGPTGNRTLQNATTDWVYATLTFFNFATSQVSTTSQFAIPFCETQGCISYKSVTGVGGTSTQTLTTQWWINKNAANTLGPAAANLAYAGSYRMAITAAWRNGATNQIDSTSNSDWDQGPAGSYGNSQAGYLTTTANVTSYETYHADEGCAQPESQITRGESICGKIQTETTPWRLQPDYDQNWMKTANTAFDGSVQTVSSQGDVGTMQTPLQTGSRTIFLFGDAGGVYARAYDANMKIQ